MISMPSIGARALIFGTIRRAWPNCGRKRGGSRRFLVQIPRLLPMYVEFEFVSQEYLRSFVIQVESLAFDVDYRSKISRQKFEDACADLQDKFAQPILDAIAKAGLTVVRLFRSSIVSRWQLTLIFRRTYRV